ncbi:MAG: glycosyltransferase 87 family protein [Acidimicrobiales bacterium]
MSPPRTSADVNNRSGGIPVSDPAPASPAASSTLPHHVTTTLAELRRRAERPRVRFGLCALAVTAWSVWGYLRLRPPAGVALANGHVKGYHTWSFAHLAYSDLPWLYQEHGFYTHGIPYIHVPIEYPVVTGVFAWLTAWFPGVQGYFLANVIAEWAMAIGVLWLLYKLVPQRYYLFAISPLLLVYLFLNWDILGIFLMLLAYKLYSDKRWSASGAVFSLAVFAKLFPIFYLPFIAAQLWRDGSRKPLRKLATSFSAVSIVINAPFMILGFHNWQTFYTFNASRGGKGIAIAAVDAVTFMIVLAALLLLVRHVLHGGSVPRASAFAFAVFLMVNKVFSPQYMLWLLAFALLAEWPVWTSWVLAGGGAIDYVNSFTYLHFAWSPTRHTVPSHLGATARWYIAQLYDYGIAARYLAILTSTIGAAFSQRRERSSESLHPQTADPLQVRGSPSQRSG